MVVVILRVWVRRVEKFVLTASTWIRGCRWGWG